MNIQSALLVDDSISAILTLRKHLEQRGIQVDWVDSGASALKFLEHRIPDVIFVDSIMPDMDGQETVQRIRRNPALTSTPIVMCSARISYEERERIRGDGNFEFLRKPYEGKEINRVLTRAEKSLGDEGGATAADTDPRKPRAGHGGADLVSREGWERRARIAAEDVARHTALRVAQTTATDVANRLAKQLAQQEAAQVVARIVPETARTEARGVAERIAREQAETIAREVARGQAEAVAEVGVRAVAPKIVVETIRTLGEETARRQVLAAWGEIEQDIHKRVLEEVGKVAADYVHSQDFQRDVMQNLEQSVTELARSAVDRVAGTSARLVAERVAAKIADDIARDVTRDIARQSAEQATKGSAAAMRLVKQYADRQRTINVLLSLGLAAALAAIGFLLWTGGVVG